MQLLLLDLCAQDMKTSYLLLVVLIVPCRHPFVFVYLATLLSFLCTMVDVLWLM